MSKGNVGESVGGSFLIVLLQKRVAERWVKTIQDNLENGPGRDLTNSAKRFVDAFIECKVL